LPSENHWFKFFHRDWLSSGTVARMTCAARGVYVHLLCHQWEFGSLPGDPKEVRRLACAEQSDWRQFAKWLDDCFPLGDDGQRRNRRLDDISEVTAARIKAGAKGGATTQANAKQNAKQNAGKTPANGQAKLEQTAKQRPEQSSSKQGGIPETRNQKPEVSSSGNQEIPFEGASPPRETSSIEPGKKLTTPLWAAVFRILAAVCAELGWTEPAEADVRRNLGAKCGLRMLVAEVGDDQSVAMFVHACRNWKGAVTWDAVFNQRNRLMEQMSTVSHEARIDRELAELEGAA